MSDLVVIEFPSEARAEEVRHMLLDMQQEYLIELGDALIATRQPNGRIKLNQLYHPELTSAAYGGLWGLILGAIFFLPIIGAAFGVAYGALIGALSDVGINDRFAREVADTIDSGNAALFLLIRKMTTDKVLEDLKGVGGKVLRTSFDHSQEDALRAALAAATAAQSDTVPPDPVQPPPPPPVQPGPNGPV
ncbi:MAG: rane protein [Devosia sp.]|uniref:DUF1269 domain-containing protein n=1 Tax=Devosia sp. TaxID=1871048 RepID=UPI00261866A2|nr:DUF1269 domain-containing protein [Devosia sp.]MDB5539232.1 rane protein [Devosia sp.]